MGSDPGFIQYVADQLNGAGDITYRKMFGEYALYNNGKVIGLVCNDQLFINPTEAGRLFIGEPAEAPPYPGAKMYFLIEDQIDNRDWLIKLVSLTTHELPPPKPKKKKAKKK